MDRDGFIAASEWDVNEAPRRLRRMEYESRRYAAACGGKLPLAGIIFLEVMLMNADSTQQPMPMAPA